MTTGSLGTPLTRKLGIRQGDRVGTFGAPDSLGELLGPLPSGAALVRSPRTACEVLITFATNATDLDGRLLRAVAVLPADGALWVAWPKQASGVETDLDFAQVQALGLEAGLVDNKVAAIDDTWSGLRFVVRTEDRPGWSP